MTSGMLDTELTAQLMDGASTKALGWILEQHCEVRWTDDSLELFFVGNHQIAHEVLHEDDTLRTLGQMASYLTKRDCAVRIIDVQDRNDVPPARAEAPREVFDATRELLSPLPLSEPGDIHNQGYVIHESAPLVLWHNLRFRSQSEVRIAEALDRTGVMFLPNCRARLGGQDRWTREADFLICHQGRWGVLEVDGEPFHPPARTVDDHRRDRLFREHGIRLVEHFDATECYQHADRVVQKFLHLLEHIG